MKYRGLEFRLGNGRQTQSIAPPSIVDGVQREWIITPEECEPPPLTEHVINILLTCPKSKSKTKTAHAEIPEARNAMVKRLQRYCKRVGLAIKGVREDHDALTFIDLAVCPFKSPENEKGTPAIIVNPDGTFAFHCFHAGCADKKWTDVEKEYGPLRPTICIGTDLDRMVAQSIQALGEDPNTYQHGALSEIVEEPPKPKLCLTDTGAPQLRIISVPTLERKLSVCAKYQKWNKKNEEWDSALPPDPVVKAVLSRR